jgi:hypothetical protein
MIRRCLLGRTNAALLRELDIIFDGDRFPFSPRVVSLKTILAKIRPEPGREPLPPLKHYEPLGLESSETGRTMLMPRFRYPIGTR